MIEAGSETTSQLLNNTIIGLLSNPVAVKKAQEELDRVIGPDRTPTFNDEKDLPYIRSIIKVRNLLYLFQESLRWRSTNKFGHIHYVTQDDWYEGYFIPKKTIVMMNVWALHFDPEYFPEPDKVETLRESYKVHSRALFGLRIIGCRVCRAP
jgi:cytochrome P450